MPKAETSAAVEQLRMSVVLLVDQQRERGARCLSSVLAQSIVDRLEVLLLDLGGAAAGPLPGSEHPRVCVLRLPPTMSFGALQAEGVLRARAPIVAFLEEHCVALPGWAEALVLAHEGPAAAVGGERHNPTPWRSLAQFIHLLDHGPWS
ncbi:MAG: glycosyltransferase family 2 protein, partial [Thermoanaerobaculia bacterium]